MVKLIMVKLNYTKLNEAKLNHGLNIYYKFVNFIYLKKNWQVKLFYFILFGIFFKKCKFD
jgi:hypothetical protein